MNVSALLASAGINIAISVGLLSLYSVLRKQPGNARVYFGRKLAQERKQTFHPPSLERFVPSPSWIIKALKTSDEEILASSGLDALIFIRIIVFSIRFFTIACIACTFGVLPLNYYFGQFGTHHLKIPLESLAVFTIAGVYEGSKCLWVHCLALYIISFSAGILLYFEYKRIARLRLVHIIKSGPNPSHFTVLVRAIPWSVGESLSDTIKCFFTNYHASSYLAHQMIYRVGKLHMLMTGAEKACKELCLNTNIVNQNCRPQKYTHGHCGGAHDSQDYQKEFDLGVKRNSINFSDTKLKECDAAFVFFKTRYAAAVASKSILSSNPMSWVTTGLAPEPHDVYWSNLWIPYNQLWFRKIATITVTIVFTLMFFVPVTLVQGLTQLDRLQKEFSFLRVCLTRGYIARIITGYLPSVVLLLFLYVVPPMMMLFSSWEAPISHSRRRSSACYKVVVFYVWNVFFVNVLSASIINRVNILFTPKQIPIELAQAVPSQATFFITYVLTSGWATLSFETIQFFPFLRNSLRKIVLRKKDDPIYVPLFPYHTEIARVLLFGLLGITYAILAPLILPFLLLYFLLSYVVYRNQILNVYESKYETGGLMWPIAYNITMFSLFLAQIIAFGVFRIKKSPVVSWFVIPLMICTILFYKYCWKRFRPIFTNISTQVLMDMDAEDKNYGRMSEIYLRLLSAYSQFPNDNNELDDREEIVSVVK